MEGDQEVLRRFALRSGDSESCLYAFWHGDELVLLSHYSFRGLVVLSSLSKDGTIMARVLNLLGYRVFRGSSSKGGARGLLNMIRAVKAGAQSAIAVDGPKGPLHVCKPGIVELALRTSRPVIPVRAFADRAWFIPRAWNQSYVPKPLARVRVVYGPPVTVSDDFSASCRAIEMALKAIR